MGSRLALEAPPFHDARKALSLGNTRHIYSLAWNKMLRAQFKSDWKQRIRMDLEFSKDSLGFNASILKLSEQLRAQIFRFS